MSKTTLYFKLCNVNITVKKLQIDLNLKVGLVREGPSFSRTHWGQHVQEQQHWRQQDWGQHVHVHVQDQLQTTRF